jgi:hypothetical protein
MRIVTPTLSFAKATQAELDHYKDWPLPQLALTLTPLDLVSTNSSGVNRVYGQPSLPEALNQAWQQNIHKRQLYFALSKLINGHRSSTQRNALLPPNDASSGCQPPGDVRMGLSLTLVDTLLEDIQRFCEQLPGGDELHAPCQTVLQQARRVRAAWTESLPIPCPDAEDGGEMSHGGGGAIVVDVDEAIHGLYAAMSYAVQAMKGGAKETAREFAEEARLLGSAPVEWLKEQGTPHGMADFALGAAVGGVLLPFSILAMKAGVEEVNGARAEHTRLHTLKNHLQESLGNLRTSTAPPLSAAVAQPLDLRRLQIEQQLAEHDFNVEQNREGGMVGAFSLASGTTIAAKVLLDVGSKVAHVATSGAEVAVAATAAAGIAGTVVLGPLAAGSAMGLGAYILHKSATKARVFAAERALTLEALESVLIESSQPAVQRYHDFLQKKLDQHEHFFNEYRDWNKGFLAGSGIYTLGTLTKVGVVAAAGAGLVAVAEPVTLATVIALGALGGAVMGVSSQQFISGHGRHHRYEKYSKDDDLELDRHFLAAADLLCLSDKQCTPLTGLEMRADFHRHIYQREEARQDLLEKVAEDTGKSFKGRYTYTADTEATRAKRGEKPSKGHVFKTALGQRKDNTTARFAAALAFGGGLASGRTRGAVEDARKSWNDQRSVLSKTHLAAWLNTHDVDSFLKPMLDQQVELMEQRAELKIRTYAAVKSLSTAYRGFDGEMENGRQFRQVLLELDRDLEKDARFYQQLSDVRDSLETPAHDDEERSRRLTRFVLLQQGRCFDPAASAEPLPAAHASLAKHLLEEAPSRYRDLRGQLIETELEATRLRRHFENVVRSSQTEPALLPAMT